jgi:hypothetical protein
MMVDDKLIKDDGRRRKEGRQLPTTEDELL